MSIVSKKSVEPDASGLFWEGRVAEALGVERKLIAKLRKAHLAEGADFSRLANNAVALTAAGLAAIERLLSTGGNEAPGQKNRSDAGLPAGKPPADVPPGPPPRERMTILRIGPNPQVLLCAGTTPPRQVVVKVRESVNFSAGMEIVAIRSCDGVWQFYNRPRGDESTTGRLPRRKGVW